MDAVPEKLEELLEGVQPAEHGSGPLLQRDYWAVVDACRLSPVEVAELVKRRFADFPPENLVVFRRREGEDDPLEVGDEMRIEIAMAGETAVRVVHADRNSLTVATLEGHPEAGRITFGAYRNGRGDVIFHIRSRARSSSHTRYLGFLAAGEPMQTNTWTDFIDRLAHTVGEGVIGAIHAETSEVEEEADPEELASPTFVARGE